MPTGTRKTGSPASLQLAARINNLQKQLQRATRAHAQLQSTCHVLVRESSRSRSLSGAGFLVSLLPGCACSVPWRCLGRPCMFSMCSRLSLERLSLCLPWLFNTLWFRSARVFLFRLWGPVLLLALGGVPGNIHHIILKPDAEAHVRVMVLTILCPCMLGPADPLSTIRQFLGSGLKLASLLYIVSSPN